MLCRIGHMRGARGPSLAIVVAGLVAVVVGITREDAAGACRVRGACALRLPAPITISTGRAGYRVARDGRVRRVAAASSPYPRGASWFPGTGTWFEIRGHHLVVGGGRRMLWRSHEEIAADRLGVIAAGPRAVAFQHDHMLYLATYGGAERPVAPRELPVGWTAGGLYTYSYPRHRLLMRADTGAVLNTVGPRRPLEYELDPRTGSVYFIAHGVLMGAHGARTWRLGSLRDFGMSADTWMVGLGGLVELQGERRLVIVRPDGSLFASTPLPRDQGRPDAPSSQLQIAPRADAVAFTVAFGRTDNPETNRRARGAEIVYVLRAGEDAAIPLHVEQVAFGVCERGASLQWHGSWLLYSNSEGSLAAVDTAGVHRTIELSGFVRGRLGTGRGVAAAWSR
jgi:hypothetical protein